MVKVLLKDGMIVLEKVNPKVMMLSNYSEKPEVLIGVLQPS